MTSDREIIKNKVVDLKKLKFFVVNNLFIWIRLWSQILISKPDKHKIGWTNIPNGHKCFMCGVVGGRMYDPQVMGSSVGDHEACVFVWKITWLLTCDRMDSLLELVHVNKDFLLFLLADFDFWENCWSHYRLKKPAMIKGFEPAAKTFSTVVSGTQW